MLKTRPIRDPHSAILRCPLTPSTSYLLIFCRSSLMTHPISPGYPSASIVLTPLSVAAACPGQKESASGRRKATLSVFKHLNDLLVRHAFVPFQKIANCRARLKVLEQSRYRQPGTFEYKRAANPPGHSFYRVAIRPVQHAMTLSNLAAGVKRRANVNIARRLRSETSMSRQWMPTG